MDLQGAMGGDLGHEFTLANKRLLLLTETLGHSQCLQGRSGESQAENRDALHRKPSTKVSYEHMH